MIIIFQGVKLVATFLDETWQLIISATDILNILKDKETTVNINKFSSNHILHEFCTLSENVTFGNYVFNLLYVKDEDYTLFMHNNTTGEDSVVANFKWKDNPTIISELDEYDDKMQLLHEKLQSIDTNLDVFKIKDALLKSLVLISKDMNKKMELLNNRSEFINNYLKDVISTLRTKHFDNLNKTIKEMLSEHKSPSKQMLADYLNASDEFYIVHDIKKRFKKTPHGFVEITPNDISNYNEFGYNKVSMKR